MVDRAQSLDGSPFPQDDSNPRQAWQEVFNCCEAGLRAFLGMRLHQQVDVDDCLQNVVIKMMEAAADQQRQVAPAARRAWLFRVAANEAAELWRRKASTQKMMGKHGPSDDFIADPIEKVTLTETTLKVRQAIDGLPAKMKQVVKLRIDENLTFKEIAQQLDIPLGTALTTMRRAMSRLENTIRELE